MIVPLNKISFKGLLDIGKGGQMYDWWSASYDEPIGKVIFGDNGFILCSYVDGKMDDMTEQITGMGYIPMSVYSDDYFTIRL